MLDIALELNLSISTVSKALQNKPDISKATRERVQLVADKLGYKPDPGLCSLIAHRKAIQVRPYSGNIAMVSTYLPFEEWIKFPWAAELHQGALEESKRMGYNLDYFFALPTIKEQMKLANIIRARGIRGVLMLPNVNHQWERPPCWNEFAIVSVFGNPSFRNTDCVASHHYSDITMVLEQIRNRGYQRPGLILEQNISLTTDFDWLGSFLAHGHWFKASNAESVYTLRSSSMLIDNKSSIYRWVRKTNIDVVIANSALYLDLVQDETLRDFSDIGYCALALEPQDAEVSGIKQPIGRIGSAAVSKLISILQNSDARNSLNPSATLLSGQWNEGKTLRKVSNFSIAAN